MEITWLGVVLFPLGVLLFVVAPKWLYAIAVFSIPFTATSLLNMPSGVPLSPLQFLGSLVILNQGLVLLSKGGARLSFHGDKSLFLLFLFLGIVVLSTMMPGIIDGKLWVSSSRLFDLYEAPVQLTEQSLKYPLPVVFGVLLSTCLVLRNDTPEKLRFTIKMYVVSGVFVSLWGLFQFLCNAVLGVEYPYYIFNNALIESMQGHLQVIEVDGGVFSRISSVTHEPSILAKYLLTVISVMNIFVWTKRRLFGPIWDKIVLLILVGVLALMTSAIGYFGFVGVLLLSAILMSRFRPTSWSWVVLAGFVGFVILLIGFLVPLFREVFVAQIFLKFESGSALERVLSISNSWQYFLKYPLLGVGWAIVTSHDLVVNLLVNTGVIGLTAFVALLLTIFRHSLRTLSKCSQTGPAQLEDAFALVAGLLVALSSLVLTGVVSGLEFYLGYFYFVLGVLIAANIVVRRLVGTGLPGASSRAQRGESNAHAVHP